MTRIEYLQRYNLMLQDVSHALSEADRINCLTLAVQAYSKLRPYFKVEDQSGTDKAQLALPSEWEPGVSRVVKCELIRMIDAVEYPEEFPISQLYSTPNTTYIQTLVTTQSSATYRVRFTASHILDDTTSTIPDHDAQAVLAYAAHQGCLILAAQTLHNIEPSLRDAVVDRKNESTRYQALAEEYCSLWKELMGLTAASSYKTSMQGETGNGTSSATAWRKLDVRYLSHFRCSKDLQNLGI